MSFGTAGQRKGHLHLPSPGYADGSGRAYPALYLHDGQNMFHPAYNGQSWNLHLAADRLIAEGKIEEIVMIGVANMEGERANEYTHALEGVDYKRDKWNIEPKGELYERFLIEELKPFVDRLLRTKTGPEHTALLGSSRGGQVTYHIGMRRPDVFGHLGIISPYLYHVDPADLTETRVYARFAEKKPLEKIWIDLGGREGTLIMEKHVRGLVRELLDAGYEPDRQLAYYFDPDAEHTERDWERRAELPLIHFFGRRGELARLTLTEAKATVMHGEDAVCRIVASAEYEGGLKLTPLGGAFASAGTAPARIDGEGVVRSPRCENAKVAFRFGASSAELDWAPRPRTESPISG
ncbi:alpha/beta hydrolase [Cohnella algarum]|uniref:alpha/beta hydrolase n=1 Tax=Cohnella algarum TaxID=2044859 RepID=UPI0030841852